MLSLPLCVVAAIFATVRQARWLRGRREPAMPDQLEGGCFCGAVRYRVEGAPIDAGFCHCRMCQRASGAPVLAWGHWRDEAFRWLEGEPAVLHSSARGERSFCGRCGTHMLFRDPTDPGLIDINVATLDDPASVPPEYHIWTASRIPWFDTIDTLPRYPDGDSDQPQPRGG